ncbi:MAG: class I SAM-dependent methyltransferase [Bacteroidota bacterium]
MSPRRKREWFDDDDMWRDLYPFMFPQSRMDGTAAEVENLIRLVRPRGKDVLDLCCGPGRFAVELAKRKLRVTGVDRTRFLLAKARAKARAARVSVEWVREDMRDFVRPSAYDLAISMFTSFGYFDDKGEDLLVLRHVHESLKPGGAFVAQMGGKEWLARIFSPVTEQTLPDGTRLVAEHEIFDDWTRIRNRWILIRGARAKTFAFHHTLYSGQELRDRMEQAGFTGVRLYGELDGSEYGRTSRWLIAVGRRP